MLNPSILHADDSATSGEKFDILKSKTIIQSQLAKQLLFKYQVKKELNWNTIENKVANTQIHDYLSWGKEKQKFIGRRNHGIKGFLFSTVSPTPKNFKVFLHMLWFRVNAN